MKEQAYFCHYEKWVKGKGLVPCEHKLIPRGAPTKFYYCSLVEGGCGSDWIADVIQKKAYEGKVSNDQTS